MMGKPMWIHRSPTVVIFAGSQLRLPLKAMFHQKMTSIMNTEYMEGIFEQIDETAKTTSFSHSVHRLL